MKRLSGKPYGTAKNMGMMAKEVGLTEGDGFFLLKDGKHYLTLTDGKESAVIPLELDTYDVVQDGIIVPSETVKAIQKAKCAIVIYPDRVICDDKQYSLGSLLPEKFMVACKKFHWKWFDPFRGEKAVTIHVHQLANVAKALGVSCVKLRFSAGTSNVMVEPYYVSEKQHGFGMLAGFVDGNIPKGDEHD